MAMGLKELLCVALLVGAAAAQRRQAIAENDVYIDDQASLVRSNPQYVNSNNNNPAALAQVAIVGYEDPAAAGSYDYNYAVKDEVAGNVQQAREVRDGGQTQGSYGVLQPDGFFRSVVYRVEGDQGFEADVSYSRGAAAGSEQQYIPNDGRQSRSTAGTRSESAVQTYFPYVTVAGDGSPSPNSFDVRVVDSAELEEIQKQQQQVYQQQQQQVYQQQQQQVYQQQQPSGANSPAQEALYQPSDYYRLLPGQPQPINFFPAFIPASEPDIQYFTMSDVVLGAKKDGAPVQGQEQPQGNVRPYYPLPQHVVLPAVPAYESNDEYDDSQEYDEAEEDLNDPPADSVEEDFGKASPKVEEEQQKVTQPAPVQQQKQERVEVVQPDVEVAHAPAPFVEQKVVEEKVEQPVEVKITEQKPVEVKATTESPLVIKKVVKIPKPAFQTYNGKLPVVDFRNLKFGPGSKAPAPVVQPKNTRRQHQPKRGPKVRIIQSSPKHKRQLPQQGLFSANVNGAGAAGLQQLFSGFPGSQQLNGAQQGPGGFPGGFPGAQQLNGAQQGPGGFPGGFPGAQQLPGGFPGARQAPSRGFPGLGASPFSGGQFPGAFPQLSQAALRQFGQQQGNPFAGLQAGQIFPGLNFRSPQGSFGKRPRDDQRKVVEDQNELPDLEALGFGKNGDFEVREVKSIKEALRLLEQQGENGETVSTSNTQDDQEEDEEEPEGVVRQVFWQQKRQQQRGQGAAGLDTNGALAAIQAFNALSNPSLALGQQPGGQGSPNFPGAGSGFPGAAAGPGFPGAGAGSGFPGAGAAFGQGFPGLGQPFGLPQPGGQPQQDGPQSQGFPGAPQFLPENDGDFFGPSDPSQQQSPFGPPQGNFRNPDNFPSQLASDVGGFGPLQLAQAGPVRNRRPVGGPGSNNGNRPGRNANRPRGNRPTRNTNDNGNNQQRGRLRNFPALNFGALRGLLPSFGRQQGNNNNNRGRSQRSVSTQISVPEVEGERPAADFIPPEVLPLQGQRSRRSRRNRQNKDGAASSQRRRSGRRSFSV